jgi:hypothetical protein
MKRLIVALGVALAVPAFADNNGDTPSRLTPQEKAEYKDLHKTNPPREWPEVSPTTKVRAKKLVNWPGNLGEQTDLQGNVSTKGQTHDEKVGKIPPRDATH